MPFCNAPSALPLLPQTLHNWVSEELAGRSSTAALLQSTEGNQEERCKQVEPSSAANYITTSTQCPACPVPNQPPNLQDCEKEKSQLRHPVTHHLHSSCSAEQIKSVCAWQSDHSPNKLSLLCNLERLLFNICSSPGKLVVLNAFGWILILQCNNNRNACFFLF